MDKQRRIAFFILFASLLAGVVFFALRPKEPIYQGKSINAWQDDFAARKGGTDYYTAIREFGTNGLPYAVRNLALNDFTLRNKYREWRLMFPKFLQKILPVPKPLLQVVDGANVFLNIGSNAIPHAIVLLKHRSATVRQSAALGLGSLRKRFPAANQAIPALIEALSDHEEKVRFFASLAFQEMGADASDAVPALTKVLADTDQTNSLFYLRAAAASALGKIGPPAMSAIPELKKALQEKDSNFRGHTAVAIWRINSDIATTLPVLLEEMPRTSEHSKWDWIIALGEMGPSAAEAIPRLMRELKEDDQAWVRQHVTNALMKIGPEALAK